MSASDPEKQSRASVSVHFRIWKDVYDSLEVESKRRRVSLNTLANQLLSTYTRDELLEEEIGYARIPRESCREVLRLIPDDKLGELGRELFKTYPAVIMMARTGASNFDAILDLLRYTSREGWYSVHETKGVKSGTITLIHSFGERYSTAVRAGLASLFALVDVDVKITTTDSSVAIEY